MSALPLTALRPLTFPCHRWVAVLCLSTGRVLALVEARPVATADPAVSGQTRTGSNPAAPPTVRETPRPVALTAHGNASPSARDCRLLTLTR